MESRYVVGIAAIALVSMLTACDKPDTATPPAASAGQPTATAAPPAESAKVVGAASASAAPTEPLAAKAAPADSKKDGGGGPSAVGSAATVECGTKPLPDCPLQAWMKANVNPAITANDGPALAAALEKAATFAPADYTNWASIAKDGANAARANDMSAAKASCRTCHDQYKAKYKTELRARKI